MFQEQYQHLMDQVEPGEPLLRAVMEKTRHRRGPARPAVLVLAACLCLMLAVPALAARSDGMYEALYAISPATAQFFRPINLTDEDNGIQMEVVSAYIHENVAEIYIALRDLDGERVDRTTDLFDSYSIRRSFNCSAGCQPAGYDEATGTAYFLIQMKEWGNRSIEGEKITFDLKEFLSHKQVYENVEVPIDLTAVPQGEATLAEYVTGGGGTGYTASVQEQTPPILVPGQPREEFPVEGIDLTGIGYVDGKLHLQTAVMDNLDKDNHGYFYLKDKDGNIQQCSYNFYFVNHYQREGRIDYCEYVFDVPQEKLGQYVLYGDFVTCDQKIDGNWSVTFPLELEQ